MKFLLIVISIFALIACSGEASRVSHINYETECFDASCYENSIKVIWGEKNSKPTIDTIFLGFVLGQSKFDFTNKLNSLINANKIKILNRDTLYLTGWPEIKHLGMRFYFIDNHLDAIVLITNFESSQPSSPNNNNTNLINILYSRYGYDDFKFFDKNGRYNRKIFWLKGDTEISYHNHDCLKFITFPNKHTITKHCVNIVYARRKSHPYMDYLKDLDRARQDEILENEIKKQEEKLYKQRKNNIKDF